jgi:hypothetical protein
MNLKNQLSHIKKTKGDNDYAYRNRKINWNLNTINNFYFFMYICHMWWHDKKTWPIKYRMQTFKFNIGCVR